jgi:hypothetical protein
LESRGNDLACLFGYKAFSSYSVLQLPPAFFVFLYPFTVKFLRRACGGINLPRLGSGDNDLNII